MHPVVGAAEGTLLMPIPQHVALQMALCEWLGTQEPNLYGGGIFKLMPRWDKYTSMLGIMLKNMLYTWVYCYILFYLLTPKFMG
jgi:hypothetical protein